MIQRPQFEMDDGQWTVDLYEYILWLEGSTDSHGLKVEAMKQIFEKLPGLEEAAAYAMIDRGWSVSKVGPWDCHQ